jgi:hypothetical protein
MSSSNKHVTITPVAKAIPFDKDNDPGCEFVSTDVQGVIEELCERVATSASPGFTWGRSGNVNQNTWLLNDSVPSNLSGRICFLQNAAIRNIYIANEDATAGIVVEVWSHDGDEINLTLLGSVTTLAARSHTFSVNYLVAINKQIAIKIASTSATGKNLVVGCLLFGDIV